MQTLNPKIREDFLYYLWQTSQFDYAHAVTTRGQSVHIHQYGILNHQAGPDFSDALLSVDGIKWAGNVEMHVFSSDWEKHQHQYDPAYKNVVLHVVFEHDRDVLFDASDHNHEIPTLELKKLIPPSLLDKYSRLMESRAWIPCASMLPEMDGEVFDIWKYSLAIQKLAAKKEYVEDVFKSVEEDWLDCLYMALFKAFGGLANGFAFEKLARLVPYKLVAQNRHHPTAVEAMLFGRAGWLDTDIDDAYYQQLKTEYAFQKKKYGWNGNPRILWRFGKIRPPGYPSFRLAQLIPILVKTDQLFHVLTEEKSARGIRKVLKVQPNSYWEEHYRFGQPSASHSVELSKDLVHRIFINALLPVLFLYGKRTGREDLSDRCVTLLDELPSEKNAVITKFGRLGMVARSALDSQALLELKNNYCQPKRCSNCQIGHQLIFNTT